MLQYLHLSSMGWPVAVSRLPSGAFLATSGEWKLASVGDSPTEACARLAGQLEELTRKVLAQELRRRRAGLEPVSA